MGYKGHYGEYSGNAKWSKNHADTEVTKSNYKASEKDDAAHIDYLKRDVDYDNKHGHSDSSMTNDEKHISKLAGDMKYDKEHHGSPGKMVVPKIGTAEKFKKTTDRVIKNATTVEDTDRTLKHAQMFGSSPFVPYRKDPAIGKVGAAGKMLSPVNRTKNWYKRKETRYTNLVEKGKDEKAEILRTKIDKSKEFDKHKKDGTKPPKEFGDNMFTTLKRN